MEYIEEYKGYMIYYDANTKLFTAVRVGSDIIFIMNSLVKIHIMIDDEVNMQ